MNQTEDMQLVTAVAKAIHQSRLDEGDTGPTWEELGECTQCMAHAQAAIMAHAIEMRKKIMAVMNETELH